MIGARQFSVFLACFVLIRALICALLKIENMTDSRYWSKDVVTNFIEIYKAHPCLWKIKSKEYTNRNLKNAAYDKLVEFSKTINPEANRDYVVKKIQSFRGSFRKELKKMEDSKRSGAGSDDIYSPSLWYFNSLLFTIDQELPTPSLSNIGNGEDDTETQNDIVEDTPEPEEPEIENGNESTGNIHEIPPDETPSTSANRPKTIISNKRSRSSKSNKSQADFINYCKNQIEKNDSLDEFDAAAISWAKKMKKMDSTQAIYADMLINIIINQGLLNQLTNTTTLTEQRPLLLPAFSPFTPHSTSSNSSLGHHQEQSSNCLTAYYEEASQDLMNL